MSNAFQVVIPSRRTSALYNFLMYMASVVQKSSSTSSFLSSLEGKEIWDISVKFSLKNTHTH